MLTIQLDLEVAGDRACQQPVFKRSQFFLIYRRPSSHSGRLLLLFFLLNSLEKRSIILVRLLPLSFHIPHASSSSSMSTPGRSVSLHGSAPPEPPPRNSRHTSLIPDSASDAMRSLHLGGPRSASTLPIGSRLSDLEAAPRRAYLRRSSAIEEAGSPMPPPAGVPLPPPRSMSNVSASDEANGYVLANPAMFAKSYSGTEKPPVAPRLSSTSNEYEYQDIMQAPTKKADGHDYEYQDLASASAEPAKSSPAGLVRPKILNRQVTFELEEAQYVGEAWYHGQLSREVRAISIFFLSLIFIIF